MKYELVTHDGKSFVIAQDDPAIIAKLASKLELVPVRLANGHVEYFSKGNIARLQKRSAIGIVENGLPRGNDIDRRADVNSDGYKKFPEAKKRIGRTK